MWSSYGIISNPLPDTLKKAFSRAASPSGSATSVSFAACGANSSQDFIAPTEPITYPHLPRSLSAAPSPAERPRAVSFARARFALPHLVVPVDVPERRPSRFGLPSCVGLPGRSHLFLVLGKLSPMLLEQFLIHFSPMHLRRIPDLAKRIFGYFACIATNEVG